MMRVTQPTPSRHPRCLVLLATQRGQTRITRLLAPTRRVVRGDGPPRVEFLVPPPQPDGPRAA